MNHHIQYCTDEADILKTYPVLKELRPGLSLENYPALIDTLKKEGARLIAAFNQNRVCLGVAIYRIHTLTFLNGQKEIYIDDLVVSEMARSQGIGKILMDWLKNEAKALGCVSLSLDSANHRVNAHRFYEREGFEKLITHFRHSVHSSLMHTTLPLPPP